MNKSIFFILITTLGIGSSFVRAEKIEGNGNITTQKRTIESFNRISSGGSIDIVISQSNQEGVSVETDENIQQYIMTEVKDNTLSIKIKENINLTTKKLVVKVDCRELKEIAIGGSGDVESTNVLKSEDLAISQGGSGDIKLNLETKKLKISKAGSGDFRLAGKAESVEISSAGSGDLHADELAVKNGEISMAGSGDFWFAKGTSLKISNVGSGEVQYK